MIDRARRDGDVDAVIEVLRRDLSGPHYCLQIARTCLEAKRYDERNFMKRLDRVLAVKAVGITSK